MTNLINEVYIPTKMNKINVDRELTENFSLIDFTAENPYGKLEALNGASIGRRPMFGTTHSTSTNSPYGTGHYNGIGNCVQTVCDVTVHTTYIFWINVGSNTEYNNCHDISGSGCN